VQVVLGVSLGQPVGILRISLEKIKKRKAGHFVFWKCPAFNAPVIAGNNCSCSYAKKISAGYYMWFVPHHGALSYL
jgi:hypothetical protein